FFFIIGLTEFYCLLNQLTWLDVICCQALEYLDCSRNQLTSLDVSKNTNLFELDCYYNQLTSLDVSGCKALTYVYCDEEVTIIRNTTP
ncbi:MAG: leucine-rich repeat domain-containing protein, partial [Lachnospiraceae bacterium]|nr:leucine-rich repeat domain-containing protein [Lachnospiraceae bacterium]